MAAAAGTAAGPRRAPFPAGSDAPMDHSPSALGPGLYIVATPIGNLDDITLRAIGVLRQADVIAAEDTRRTRILLDHLGLRPRRMLACHDHNEPQQAEELSELIADGGSVALVSDAGTPLICDPGYRVVRRVVEAGSRVTVLPGPCAAISALCLSGMPTDRFSFEGFMPQGGTALEQRLRQLESSAVPAIFYESPHRIQHTLQLLAGRMPQRQVVLCRELTKVYESVYRMPAAELAQRLRQDGSCGRGELVLIVAAAGPAVRGGVPAEAVQLIGLLRGSMALREACRIAARHYGLRSNELYAHLLEREDGPGA